MVAQLAAAALLLLLAGDAVPLARPLVVTLNPPASTRPCTVAEVQHASMPAAATWIRLRPNATATPAEWPCGKRCWFRRTAPKNGSRFEGPVGIQQLAFCALAEAAPGSSIALVAEAWSDRNDLGDGMTARLLASSDPFTFTFNDLGFAEQASFVNFSAVERAPGWVTIRAQPADERWYSMAKLLAWSGYEATPSTGRLVGSALPTFSGNTGLLGDVYTTQEFATPSVNVSYSRPGVRFVGLAEAYAAYKPAWYSTGSLMHQQSWPRDRATGKTFQPFAVITPWENGTLPSLPAGFDGPRIVTKPIPGDWRLALRVSKMTVFDGGVVYVRAVNGFVSPVGPDVVELDVPQGLRIVVPAGAGLTCCSGYRNVSDVSGLPGGGSVPQGYVRLRLIKQPTYEWSYVNAAIELRIEVDASLVGKAFPQSRIRAYSGAPNQQREDNWQPLAVTVKALVPVPVLPKRLHTSFCFAFPRQFVDDHAHGLSSIQTWRDLGFTTVPGDGASYATPFAGGGPTPGGTPKLPILAPAERTGEEWAGMKYGLMTTPFTSEGLSAPPLGLGTFEALVMPVAAADSASAFNFSAHGLTAEQEKVERAKWKAALRFYEAEKIIDLAYDGYFLQHDLDAIQRIVNYSQPDYLSMDIETLPQLEKWVELGFKSANFAAAKRRGESDSDAAVRLGASWVGGIVAAAKAVQPRVRVYFYNIWAQYGAGFQSISWEKARQLGLADMPSFYERPIQNDLQTMAEYVRDERLTIGTGSELIPWLTPGQTPGTDGPHSADPGAALFNTLIQAFASGATGFNVFDDDGVYDMAIWLAFRDAVALVAPHEDLIMDGFPAPNGTFSQVAPGAVVSAMQAADGSAMLIASSTVPPGRPTSFAVSMPSAAGGTLCDLRTRRCVPVPADGEAPWSCEAEGGAVLLLAK